MQTPRRLLPQADGIAWLQQHQQKRTALLDALGRSPLSGRSLQPALLRLSEWTDQLLRRLWRRAGLDAEHVSLLALGGYGRQELFPHSDTDVMLLLPAGCDVAAQAGLRACIEAFVGSCWDAGLELAASVRSLDECLALARRDVTVQTALLEMRQVAGNSALLDALRHGFAQDFDALAFFRAKLQETGQRHQKYAHTPYALEPNCKESPGGLRDVQLIGWLARAAGLGPRGQDWLAAGLITAHEWQQLRRNQALLSRIRLRLHLVARRREDRLAFELQEAVADAFGLQHRRGPQGRIALRASELLMRRYYWAAKAVHQLSAILLQVLEQRLQQALGQQTAPLRRLNPRFGTRAGWLEVVDARLYERQPLALIETFVLLAAHPKLHGLSAPTLRALYNARARMNRAWRQAPENRHLFLALLQQPQGVTRALQAMNQTSVLGRYLWAFRRVVGQMQHDLFHAYTVDQHTLAVVGHLLGFFEPGGPPEDRTQAELAAQWAAHQPPWPLVVAALFHDIAKGRGGDHAKLGAHEVRRFCRQHAIGRDDARLIEFLVRDHLLLSHVAQKQDISDPQVVAHFAQRVGDPHRLTGLYLLTVADLRGTGPKVWSPWKGKLLHQLYLHARAALAGASTDTRTVLIQRKRAALALLRTDSTAPARAPALWRKLGPSYFLRHEAADIVWHTQLLAQHPPGTRATLVRARPWPQGHGLQVFIATHNRPELFARICAWLGHQHWSILEARIHTTEQDWALDTFEVTSTLPGPASRAASAQLEQQLAAALDAPGALPAPRLGRLSPRGRSFPAAPQLQLQADTAQGGWLLQLSGSDRPGLLYGIAHLLSARQISVEWARISTLGERVEDVFLLRGNALEQPGPRQQLLQTLQQLLHPPENGLLTISAPAGPK